MGLVLTLLFIIIVYCIVTMYDPDDPFVMSGLLAVCVSFFILLYYSKTATDVAENLIDQINYMPGDNRLRNPYGNVVGVKGNLQFDDQDHALSKYGNISRNFDVAPVGQTDRDYNFPNDELDNGDVVTQFLTGGANTYVPGEVKSANYYSVHDLAYPKHPGQEMGAGSDLLYGNGVPLNERAINMDDKLSRGQKHIAQINKRAIDGAVRATRNQFDKYFANELDEAEKREWWGGQAEDNETDYKYYD